MKKVKILFSLLLVLSVSASSIGARSISPIITDDYDDADQGGYCPKVVQTLKRGMTDVQTSPRGQVTELQKFLMDYYDWTPSTILLGVFDRATQRVVMGFQKEQGLPARGTVGVLTRERIAQVCGGGGIPLNSTSQNRVESNVSDSQSASTFVINNSSINKNLPNALVFSRTVRNNSRFNVVSLNTCYEKVTIKANAFSTDYYYSYDTGYFYNNIQSASYNCFDGGFYKLQPGQSKTLGGNFRLGTLLMNHVYGNMSDVSVEIGENQLVHRFDIQKNDGALVFLNSGTPATTSISCNITTDKPSYNLGETIQLSWSGNTGDIYFMPNTSGADSLQVPTGK